MFEKLTFEKCAGQIRASVDAVIKEAKRHLVAILQFAVATVACQILLKQ